GAFQRPSTPVMCSEPSGPSSIVTPRARSASIITLASSLLISVLWSLEVPFASAASSSARLVRLLEPGGRTEASKVRGGGGSARTGGSSAMGRLSASIALLGRFFLAPEDGDHILDGDHEEAVVALEVHGDR